MSRIRLTGADELFHHQIPYTHDTVFTTDPDFRERLWCSLADGNGEILVDCGIAQYPNRNVQEAWAGVTVGDRQQNVRMSRRLRPATDEMRVGPLRVEHPEPLRRIRFVLEENPSGVAFDVMVESRFHPHVEDHHLEIRDGKIVHDLSRYTKAVAASGVVCWPGGEAKIEPDGWRGGRDHSWGVQPDQQSGGDPSMYTSRRGSLFNLHYLHFEEWGIYAYVHEREPGFYDYLSAELLRPIDDPRGNERIVSFEHDLRWDRDSPIQRLTGGDFRVRTESGEEIEYSVSALRQRYFLRNALYYGYRGWFQGMDRGESYFEHDVWDLTDPIVLREVAIAGAGCDHAFECRSGGQTGHGVLEYFVLPGYPRYEEVQTKR